MRITVAGSVSLFLNLKMVATALLGVVLFREYLGRAGWIGVMGVVAGCCSPDPAQAPPTSA